MKKILLIAIVGTLFATASAFGHCGACGAGDKAHAHADVKECKAECAKACCATDAKACCGTDAKACCGADAKACCGTDAKACCGSKAAKCAADCDKPCCAVKKADETAVKAPSASACCPATKVGEPA